MIPSVFHSLSLSLCTVECLPCSFILYASVYVLTAERVCFYFYYIFAEQIKLFRNKRDSTLEIFLGFASTFLFSAAND